MLYLAIIGAAAGFIATRIMKLKTGVFQTVALGVIGALFAGVVLRVLIAIMGAVAGLVGAVLAVMALIYVYQQFAKKG